MMPFCGFNDSLVSGTIAARLDVIKIHGRGLGAMVTVQTGGRGQVGQSDVESAGREMKSGVTFIAALYESINTYCRTNFKPHYD